jgi:uncharacterized membrane protein
MDPKSSDTQSLFSLERILTGLLSLVGFGIMAYLTYIHYANATSFCDISETVSCDVVTTGIYSEIFGLPVSILGLGYFGLTFLLILFNRKKSVFQLLFFLTLFVLIPSLYLSSLELLVIKSWCILCETSKALMFAILAISFVAMKEKASVVFRMAIPIIIAGLVAAGVTYFAQTSGGAQKDYTPFVEALNEKGVVYYKSYTCTNCKRQEKTIGDAYKKLNSVECHPDGPDGNPELCLQKDISHTPTFILEPGGVEVKRVDGLQSLEELADFAGVPREKLEE